MSITGGNELVLDCGAVTADKGVEIDESEGGWMSNEDGDADERGDAEDLEKSRCNEGFLSLRARVGKEWSDSDWV